MYALYSKKRKSRKVNVVHYEFSEEASLFGCNSGWIPYLMLQEAPPDASEPYAWEVGIESALRADDHPDSALLIDLKPRDVQPNLSLVPADLGELVAFVADDLAAFDESLEAGDLVLSGSFIAEAVPLEAGQQAVAAFGALGSVSVRAAAQQGLATDRGLHCTSNGRDPRRS